MELAGAVCEPPTPGFCVGLSQSECYCKVSGFTGGVPFPLPSPLCCATQLCASSSAWHSTSPLLPFECLHLHTCPHQPKPLPSLLPQHWFSTFQPKCAPTPHFWVPTDSDGGQGLYSASSPPAEGAWGDHTGLLRPGSRGGEMD